MEQPKETGRKRTYGEKDHMHAEKPKKLPQEKRNKKKKSN